MPLTYTSDFAKTISLPFTGNPGECLINKNSTIEDFLKCKDNWFSVTGKKFTKKDMYDFWKIIENQKIRIEKFYRGIPLNSKLQN